MVREELQNSGKKKFLIWQNKPDSRQWYTCVGFKRFWFQLGEELGEKDHLKKEEEQQGKGFGKEDQERDLFFSAQERECQPIVINTLLNFI